MKIEIIQGLNMELEEFKEELLNKAKMLNVELSETQVNQFYTYMKMIQEWNEKINLTAILEPKEMILKHFIDSITILGDIKENAKIVDIGTGAGFPGIPIKIVRPDTEIVLLDSLNKRINFLNNVIEELKLEKIKTIHSRAEDFGANNQNREAFDVAVSRAVAPMNVLLEYLLSTVKVGGICICMKGPEIDEEIEESKNAAKILGGKIEKIQKIELVNSGNQRTLINVKKINITPNKYPRNAGTPSKKPL